MRFLVSTAVLVLVLAGAAQAADAVKIELKVGAPAEYWIRNKERSQRDSFLTTPARGMRDWHEVDTLELVRQTSRAGDPGFLEVTVEPLGKSVRINNRKVDLPEDRNPFQYRITTKNEMPDAAAMGEIAASLAPALPAEAIPVGHKWTVKLAPSKEFPHPFEITHRLDKVETYQGEQAALIVSEGQTTAKDAELAVNFSVMGATRIGLTTGQLLRANTLTVFNVQAIGRFAEGHKIQRRQVERIVERRVPGAQDGAH